MVLTQFFVLLYFLLPANRNVEGNKSGKPAIAPCFHSETEFTRFPKDKTYFSGEQPYDSGQGETSGPPEKESINWRSRRKLNWTDFKGNPVTTAPNAALTSTSILINFGYDDRSLTYQIKCVFYPQKSWTKVASSHILSHEQGHFDISQLFTRKLHQALSNYTFKAASVDKDIQKIYQQISLDQAAFQQLYDNETNYSRNPAEQKKWQEKIETELAGLEKFASYPQ